MNNAQKFSESSSDKRGRNLLEPEQFIFLNKKNKDGDKNNITLMKHPSGNVMCHMFYYLFLLGETGETLSQKISQKGITSRPLRVDLVSKWFYRMNYLKFN